MSDNDSMSDEFDTVAWWTACAVEQLGDDHALPAACRGSGSPAWLDWLAASMGLGRGARLLDSGAGVGGPAEYATRTFGVRPTLAEPMPDACRAAHRLFGRPVVTADGSRLPFADATFDAAWSLGVLCTLPDKTSHLSELRRTVVPGGAVGLLVYTRSVEVLHDQPDVNHFPDRRELLDDLRDAGLAVVEQTLLTDLPPAPSEWDRAASRVDAAVELEHRDDERWQRAQSQQEDVAALIDEGLVVGVLLSCRST